MPYTAKIDVEIPSGSGNFFPKKGIDGINPESGRSSMFPKNWNLDRIAEETALARSKITSQNSVSGNLYEYSNSERTFKIQMYLNDLSNYKSDIGSTFPKIQ